MPSDDLEFALDWTKSGIWVQDRSLYLVADDQPADAEEIEVTDQMGNARLVNRKAFEDAHEPVRGATVYKARYAPVQAFCPPEDMRVRLQDGTSIPVPAGDALLREANGSCRVMDRHAFNCRYQFVSSGGTRAPFS
jgi:hypothetical protein